MFSCRSGQRSCLQSTACRAGQSRRPLGLYVAAVHEHIFRLWYSTDLHKRRQRRELRRRQLRGNDIEAARFAGVVHTRISLAAAQLELDTPGAFLTSSTTLQFFQAVPYPLHRSLYC